MSKKWFNNFRFVDQITIFNLVYEIETKGKRDFYAERIIVVINVNAHRPQKENAVLRDKSFKYHLLLNGKKYDIFREAS